MILQDGCWVMARGKMFGYVIGDSRVICTGEFTKIEDDEISRDDFLFQNIYFENPSGITSQTAVLSSSATPIRMLGIITRTKGGGVVLQRTGEGDVYECLYGDYGTSGDTPQEISGMIEGGDASVSGPASGPPAVTSGRSFASHAQSLARFIGEVAPNHSIRGEGLTIRGQKEKGVPRQIYQRFVPKEPIIVLNDNPTSNSVVNVSGYKMYKPTSKREVLKAMQGGK